ncbi:hypothetical protein JOL79_18965 [Microbispora sp. RL4-1S]|uniref:Uncharacterized protein n=1 Tax=Microbispora oryzae TaxID=2806554 RepID=A0A940WM50_9ACTN|nr:hypothetical protein [Microbispora oryzae]MBP2705892.1 hypothetical protein [Microbispora oryzae]
MAKREQLAILEAQPPRQDHAEESLDRLPLLTADLADAPEELQRELFEVFHLEVRYDARANTALIRVTLDSDTVSDIVSPEREGSRQPVTVRQAPSIRAR